jgi:hypothetical protein
LIENFEKLQADKAIEYLLFVEQLLEDKFDMLVDDLVE